MVTSATAPVGGRHPTDHVYVCDDDGCLTPGTQQTMCTSVTTMDALPQGSTVSETAKGSGCFRNILDNGLESVLPGTGTVYRVLK